MSPGAIASAPASAEESAGITPRDRGSQPWYKGSYSIHNPALLAKRNVLLRGQTVPRRERAATCPEEKPAMRLEMAFSAWEHMMREHA